MRVLTIVLAVAILSALALTLTLPMRYGSGLEFGTIELSSMSVSGLRLPPDEVKTALAVARESMFSRNSTGALYARLATGATWFNILCSIVITIALGWAGRTVTPAQAGNAEHLVGLPPTWAKVIGFAAALAGASAFAGNEAKQYAEQRYEAAQQLRSLIAETQRALETGDEISQREALDTLTIEAQKP